MKYFFRIAEEEGLTPEEERQLRECFGAIPPNGSIGGGQLPDGSERYLRILTRHGRVSVGRGRGGSVSRVAHEVNREKDLEVPMCHEIETRWAARPPRHYTREGNFCAAQITARKGRRKTGPLSRPDITLLGGRAYPNLAPARTVDVVSFEIKRGIQLGGVYEALAHQRAANLSYLICYFPETWKLEDDDTQRHLIATEREAARLGIGFILARREDDFLAWDERVPPIRTTPDPEYLNQFLTEQIDSSLLHKLREWLNRHSKPEQ